MLPLVSVVVPAYNAKDYIVAALQSIIDQDYGSIEIVVADDASTDGTQSQILKFVEKAPDKFKVILNQENLGITKNFNKALGACAGKYIAFLGGDDLMLPGKISTQVMYMERNQECSICYHNVEVFESETNKTLYFYNAWNKNPPRNGRVDVAIRYGCFNSGCATMIRASMLPLGGHSESFPVAADWHLWIQILLKGGEIQYLDQVLSRYRRHSRNTTSIVSPLYKQALLDSLNVTNWVMVHYPEYIDAALTSYAIHLRALRRFESGRYYRIALFKSLRIKANLLALGALLINVFSLGRVQV